MVGIVAAIAAVVMLFVLCWPRRYRISLPADLIASSSPPFDVPDQQLLSKVAAAMAVLRKQQERSVNRLTVILRMALLALALNAVAWGIVAIGVRR